MVRTVPEVAEGVFAGVGQPGSHVSSRLPALLRDLRTPSIQIPSPSRGKKESQQAETRWRYNRYLEY
jgi:hypothetical protein